MAQSDFFVGYFSPSPSEMLLLMLVALLLYGGELPKVARSWGKSLAEFKKGLTGIQNEFNSVFQDEPRRIKYHDPVYNYDSDAVEGELADSVSTDVASDEPKNEAHSSSVEKSSVEKQSASDQS